MTVLTELGWKEVCDLPGLGLSNIQAKIDTGAKTSCLHAFAVEPFTRDEAQWVRFGVHPLKQDDTEVVWLEAPVVDQRRVRDSGGHAEQRFVIAVDVVIGQSDAAAAFSTEFTLTSRDSMAFRILIGRRALAGRYVVNAAKAFCLGEPS